MLNPAQPHLPSNSLPPPAMERVIGEVVAAAARAIVRALMEYQNGGARPATTRHGGDLIAQLYALRQATIEQLDFDAMARTYGKRVLREHYADVSDAALDELVSWPLDILAKVVRSQMN